MWRVELLCPQLDGDHDGDSGHRLRGLWAALVNSVRFRDERPHEPASVEAPDPVSLADALGRHRHVLEQTYLTCHVLPNTSGRTEVEAVCKMLDRMWLETTNDAPTVVALKPTPASLAPVPEFHAAELVSQLIWTELENQAELVGLAARHANWDISLAAGRELDSATWYANFSRDGNRLAGSVSDAPWNLIVCGVDRRRIVIVLHENHD